MTHKNPGPWVNPEEMEAEPWRTQTGIVKFFEFPVRIPRMSHRAFHLYWQKHHSPNVMNVTVFAQFMRKYNSGHVYPEEIAGLPAHYQQNTPFEGAAEVWVNSMDEVAAWLGQPTYAELIQPDEPRFISQEGKVEIVITKEERLYEPVLDMNENLKTKLYVLVTRKPGAGYDEFHTAASAHGKLILAQESLRQRIAKLVISHALREPNPQGFSFGKIDAVFELWFESTDSVGKFFSEADYEKKIRPNEEEILDVTNIRAVVAKMRVVHDEFSFQPSTTQPMPFEW
ncbi:MAG: EthD domain-containing protein [Gammaproteobacteria bacterium]|nr:EthD domain-containing protein [Gammaproteobacteria bacterium]